MNATDLLDLARATTNGTDADLARRLNLAKQTVSDYRKNRRPIPDHLILTLANLAGLDPAQTLAELAADQAETREQPEVAATWRELARRSAHRAPPDRQDGPPDAPLMSSGHDRRRPGTRHYQGPERRAA